MLLQIKDAQTFMENAGQNLSKAGSLTKSCSPYVMLLGLRNKFPKANPTGSTYVEILILHHIFQHIQYVFSSNSQTIARKSIWLSIRKWFSSASKGWWKWCLKLNDVFLTQANQQVLVLIIAYISSEKPQIVLT